MAGFHVRAQHKIMPFGENRMTLFTQDGVEVATAERASVDAEWNVTSATAAPTTAQTRDEAIYALTEQALAELGGTGYSTEVAFGLMGAP